MEDDIICLGPKREHESVKKAIRELNNACRDMGLFEKVHAH